MKKRYYFLCIAVLGLSTVGLFAQEAVEAPTAVETPEAAVEDRIQIDESDLPIGQPIEQGNDDRTGIVGISDIARLLLVLLVIIGVIYGTFLLLKRVSKTQYKTSELLQLVSSLPLGGSRAIHLVKIAEQFFIVGSAEQGVHLISEITEKEVIDTIRTHGSSGDAPGGGTAAANFRQQIGALLTSIGTRKVPGGGGSDTGAHGSSTNKRIIAEFTRNKGRIANLNLGGSGGLGGGVGNSGGLGGGGASGGAGGSTGGGL